MILVEYYSNNSGGRFWLDQKDWTNLEKAGWRTFRDGEFLYSTLGQYVFDDNGLPRKNPSPAPNSWPDAPTYAFKFFNSIKEALNEFERLTGEDVSDEGCNCCGAPHNFSWSGDDKGYCSGQQCLEYLYDNPPKSLRAAVEKLSKRRQKEDVR